MREDVVINIKEVTVAHEFTLHKNQKCDYSEGRNTFGICLAVSGEAVYKLTSGERYVFKAGDVFFLPTDIAYIAVASDDFKHFTVNFSADMRSSELGAGKIILLRGRDTSRFQSLFRELCELYSYKGIGYSLRAVGYAYTIMAEFISSIYEERLTSPKELGLLSAKNYIDKNYKEPLTVSILANIASMSETGFRRDFRKILSVPPMHYRDKVRLSHAKDLLSLGYYNIGEVASLVGMEDEGYFCRFFKKHTGLTPKEFCKRRK